MDEFSWGNTRIVVNTGNKEEEMDESFDPASIPRKRIPEWETMWKAGVDEDEIAFKDCVKPIPTGNFDYPAVPQMTIPTTMPMMTAMPPMPPPTTIAPSMYGFPQQAAYAPSWTAGSQYGGMELSAMTPSVYAPSHVMSYVNQQYPAPSTYAPSSAPDDTGLDEEEIRRKRERKEKRRQKRKEREEKERETREQQIEKDFQESKVIKEPLNIDLPSVPQDEAQDGWGDFVNKF